ncbi:tape measure protein [Metapseudomonas otitidis]|uniref:tape measure protein n=1 Tax=Metapseudomonas otitidis TaxID=319939 RepID=UPI001F3F4236|nr:tape measure protein [Pseudomonas otitidis]
MAGPVSRLIQYILRGKDELSPEARKSADALEDLRSESDRLTASLDRTKSAQGLASKLADTRRAAAQTGTALQTAEARVEELQRLLSESPGNEAFTVSLRAAEGEAARLRRELGKTSTLVGKLEGDLQAAGVDVSKLAEEETRLTEALRQGQAAAAANNAAIREAEAALAAASRRAEEHRSRLRAVREGLNSAGRQALAFGAAFLSISAALSVVHQGFNLITAGIRSMLRTGDEFEGLETRLNAVMGSVEGGKKATAWIKDFAKNTPLQLGDVTEAFASMKAFGLDPMDGSLKKIEDQSEKLGGGMERLEGMVMALGQAWSKEKLQTEEVLQLIERGVPVWELLSKATGKTSAQLQDLATKGKLGRDVIKMLIDEMGKSSAGAAEANMKRLSGLISNLQDTATSFLDRIAKAGALDYVKGRLAALATTIEQMDKDGRLEKLAKALSTAFIDGARRVEQFAKQLLGVDFNKLTDESTGWLSQFGTKLDETGVRLKLFAAPFITLGAVITGGLSQVAASFVAGAAQILGVVETLAEKLPEKFGGKAMAEKASAGIQVLNGLYEGLAQHAQDSLATIANAWKANGAGVEQAAQDQAAAVKEQIDDQFEHVVQRVTGMNNALAQISAADGVAQLRQLGDEMVSAYKRGDLSQRELSAGMAMLNKRIKDAASGVKDATDKSVTQAVQRVTDLNVALAQIDTAQGAAQLRKLGDEMVAAYKRGDLSQQELASGMALLNKRLKETGGAAKAGGDGVTDLTDKLGTLVDVQNAISSAKTDIDITNIRAALKKLYDGGKIDAATYNAEVQKAAERQKELKAAVEAGRKAQADKNDADREAVKTSEELRRESGKRMEAERRAGDQAMQDRRRGVESAKRDVSSLEGYYGGVVTRAREPLANLSEAALEAFDKLQGISTVNLQLDTSSLDATTQSLQRATKALGDMQAAQNTVGMSGLGAWQARMAVQSQQVQVSFLEQKRVLQELMEGYEEGKVGLRDFISQAQGARYSLNLLNDSDLRTLEGAIQAAKERLEQLRTGTGNTLTSLQEELMNLRGETEALERSRFNSRRSDLQGQLADAQRSGDMTAISNLQRALSTLAEIEAESAQKAQREAQQKRVDELKAATPAVEPSQPTQVLRLESTGGRSVEVAVTKGSGDDLLKILEESGLRSAR